MAATKAPKTLLEAIRYYSDLDVCQAELVGARWPNGVECPTCGRKDVNYLQSQRRWQCKTKHARRQFSVKVGTIFEDSPLGLDKWFAAIWLITNCKNGVSSYEIHRGIGVTQKSAWFMLQRIRLAMQTKSFNKIGGEVEIDETYIGGKARNMHKHKREAITNRPGHPWAGKVAVLGMLDRKTGKMRTMPIPNVRKHELRGKIEQHVETGSAIYTDDLHSYRSFLTIPRVWTDNAGLRGAVRPEGFGRTV